MAVGKYEMFICKNYSFELFGGCKLNCVSKE